MKYVKFFKKKECYSLLEWCGHTQQQNGVGIPQQQNGVGIPQQQNGVGVYRSLNIHASRLLIGQLILLKVMTSYSEEIASIF